MSTEHVNRALVVYVQPNVNNAMRVRELRNDTDKY